ncbi:hypothetical protein CTM94_08035 [Photobacterium leiognathi]|uniref:Uncharacterized protein n=1 Tax=Photobacterium leiognathi TaxID=553611 RepID=A0ABX5GH19_PHOLE|nr:hypothetical protein CTM94_08035 [Photobacterium leiognathi]
MLVCITLFISRRAKSVEVSFKNQVRRAIQHLAIDTTVEVEWKVKKHGTRNCHDAYELVRSFRYEKGLSFWSENILKTYR